MFYKIKNKKPNQERIDLFEEIIDNADKVGFQNGKIKILIDVDKMYFLIFGHYPHDESLQEIKKVIQYE